MTKKKKKRAVKFSKKPSEIAVISDVAPLYDRGGRSLFFPKIKIFMRDQVARSYLRDPVGVKMEMPLVRRV